MTNLISKKFAEMKKKSIIKECLENPEKPIQHVVWNYTGDDYGHCTRQTIDALPIVENGEVKGFNMFVWNKEYNNFGSIGGVKCQPYNVKDGNNFLSVDDYVEFSDKLEKKIFKQRIERTKEGVKEATKELLDEGNKLERTRKKLAHSVDEKLGTNLEKKKIGKSLKLVEKCVSDILLGKVKD